MLVTRNHSGQRFQDHIIAMGQQFNRVRVLLSALCLIIGLQIPCASFCQAQTLPLILPEEAFKTLPRITGDTRNQRMMDMYSIIRIQGINETNPWPPETAVTVFRQGLRLRAPSGQSLGVLAIPVAQGRTLSDALRNREIAQPEQNGATWMRLDKMRQEVMRGDSVMTLTEIAERANFACQTSTDTGKNSQGSSIITVIALASQTDKMSTDGDLVVISGGCDAGLRQGSMVSFWRPSVTSFGRRLDQPVENPDNNAGSVFEDNPALSREQTPSHRVGSGIVRAIFPNAAIVQVRTMTEAIQPGDITRPNPTQRQNHEPNRTTR